MKKPKKTKAPDDTKEAEVQQERPRIYLDFLHASTGCLLVVEAPTGIEWTQQAGGVACTHPVVEGYAVPLEVSSATLAELSTITMDHYFGLTHIKGEQLKRLRAAVESLEIVVRDNQSGFGWRHHCLKLDKSRLTNEDAGEAWIPVTCVLGRGWLTFENSD